MAYATKMPVKKGDHPIPLGSILSASPALRANDRIPWHTWRGLVGSRVAARTQPLRIEAGVLHVRVSSAAWASELSLLQSPLLKKLGAFFPDVRALRFRVGPIVVPAQDPPAPPPVSVELPAALADKLEALEDESLKAVLREAASWSLGRQRKSPTGQNSR